MSHLDGAYQSRIGEAFHEAARKLDIDLFILFGRALDEPSLFSRPHNGIFELIDPRNLDGVVVVSTVLAAHTGVEGVSRFVERYGGMAKVSVGVELPGVPSVVVDNEGAMEAMVEHVLSRHGCGRVAFLAGTPDSPESEARLAGYRQALARYGIAFDPALVGYGRFMHWPARTLVGEILDRVGPIDALVAANDAMALGAAAALRERGLAVPGDVLVTGFDDIWLGQLGDSALTTISQPFERIAEGALRLTLEQIQGATGDAVLRVPADLVIRRSCGCRPGSPQRHSPASARGASSPAEHLRRARVHVAALIRSTVGTAHREEAKAGATLFDGLGAELAGERGAFLSALEAVLRDDNRDHDRHERLHDLIDKLREEFSPVATRELDDLWYRSLSRIAHDTTTSAIERRIQMDHEYSRLLGTADRISLALDLPALGDAIVSSLENVKIDTAFISRFVEPGRKLEPLASLVDGHRVDQPGQRFAAAELVPADPTATASRRTFVVFPLVFETQWLGVAAFEFVSRGYGYQMLRDQFAAALGHVTLHQQILSSTMLHERSVQERQATARRLEALSVLAGGVAHDLNNTLGPLVALPDVVAEELSRLESADRPRDLLEDLQADVQCIKSAGVRAAQTIKDLLTLGRQGRANKESLDLNRVLGETLRDPLRLIEKRNPLLKLKLELSTDPLTVMAAEAHVARAITNLVLNAADATGNGGEITIRTERVRLPEPLCGYETISPGDYAVVSVADTGSGIPASELERVFEPFFSRKRMGDQSGSGLGLAIVHGVAKEHEGFVDLTSTVGEGTTFSLYFPCSQAASRAASAPPGPTQRSARILVVDDDPVQRRTARRVLMHLGYEVDVLESGARTLELIQGAPDSDRYDLLVLDVMLNEELDGLQVLRKIRRLRPHQRAVVASGRAEATGADQDLRPGVSWLAKPYTKENLAKAVQAALAGAERESEWRGSVPLGPASQTRH